MSQVVTALPLTVTAVANTKGYDGTTSAANTPTITGSLVAGDTASFIETYGNKNAATGKTLAPSGSVNDGNNGANYSVTFANDTTGVITARAITVTAQANTKTYDGSTSAAAIPTITSGSLTTGDTASFSETYDTPNVGTGKTLTPSGTISDGNGGNNYSASFVPVMAGVINSSVGPIDHFLVTAGSSSVTAGAGFGLTVTAQDASNQTVTTYAGTVQFTSNDPSAPLPAASITFVSGSGNGVGFMTGTLYKANLTTGWTVTATDMSNGAIFGSASIDVSPAAANHFAVTAPASLTASAAISASNGATEAGTTVAITTSTTPTFTVGENVLISGVAVAGYNGVANILSVNAMTSSFTYAVAQSGLANSGGGSVNAFATTGTGFTSTVTALDPYGNTATGYTGTVKLSSSDGAATFPVNNYTFANSGNSPDNGVHAFSTTLNTAGSQTITVTDAGNSSITGSSTAVATRGLLVSAVAATTSGFTATFDKPFVPTALALYGSGTSTVQAATLIQGGPLASSSPTTITNQGTGYVQASTAVTFSAPAGAGTVQTGSAIIASSGATWANTSGGTATITTTLAHGFRVGQLVTVAGVGTGAGGYNGTFTITAVTTTTLKYLLATNPGTQTGGTVSQLAQAATGTATVSSGKVTAITITNPGSGYTTAPTITINGVGSNAVATAAITTTSIAGSLLLNSANTTATFVKTGLDVAGTSNSLLANGNYLVTLTSNTNAFKDASGATLDGTASGTPGNSYITTFSVNNTGTIATVGVADFARGPSSATNINIPNNQTTGVGLPITIVTNSSAVTDVTVTLNYDPTLLTISGANANSALAGSTFMVTIPTPGQAIFTFHTATALAANTLVRLGGAVAQVPDSAPYASKALLTFTGVSVNGGAITSLGAAGVEVVDYFGDLNASSGTINGADTSLVQRVGTGLDTGFAAFGRVDPLIIGDFNVSGKIDGTDAGIETVLASNSPSPFIPAVTIPGGGLVIGGPDPTLSLPAMQANAAGLAVVPVLLDDPRPTGSTGMTEAELALTYDPTALSVSVADIQLGSIPTSGTGWTLTSEVDAATGQIGIQLYSLTPIMSAEAGSLATITFHLIDGTAKGLTAVHLVGSVNPNGRGVIHTAVDDNQGGFILTPAPINVPGGVEGSISINGATALPQAATENTVGATPSAPESSQTAATMTDGDTIQVVAATPASNHVPVVDDETNRTDLPRSDTSTSFVAMTPASVLASANLSAPATIAPTAPIAILANVVAGSDVPNLPCGVSDIGHVVFAPLLGVTPIVSNSAAQRVEIPASPEAAHDLGGAIEEESTEPTLDDATEAMLSRRVGESRAERSELEALIA